jgi:SurA N-terminal domain
VTSGGKVRLALVVTGVLAGATFGAWAASAWEQSRRDVATVDGVPITRAQFDAYAQVFVDPDGEMQVSREQVLLSLVNQALVEREGARLGLGISGADVEEGVKAWEDTGAKVDSLDRTGGLEGLRERIRAFMLFQKVKLEVTRSVVVTSAAIEAALRADPDLAVLTRAEAEGMVRERLQREQVDAQWVQWLEGLRSCASIVVNDTSISIPTSTPLATCA